MRSAATNHCTKLKEVNPRLFDADVICMIVFHVCSLKKLLRYKKTGAIMPPVRAWENIQQAERMSKSTGRRIILRLRFPNNAPKLDGHFNQARVLNTRYELGDI